MSIPLTQLAAIRRAAVPFLTCLLLGSVALNAFQAWEFRNLKAPLDRCLAFLTTGQRTLSPPIERTGLRVGAAVPALVVHDLTGKEVKVDVARRGKLTVVYWFSPACGWCKRNSANMRSIMRAAGKQFEFVPLSASAVGTREYFAENRLPGAAYVEPSAETAVAYHFGGTPQTIVIGPDGKVVRNWIGAYRERLASDVAEVLGVSLPGLEM